MRQEIRKKERIIKTFAMDIPKDDIEVISTIEDGTAILFSDMRFVRLPEGEWKILSVEDGVIQLLPRDYDIAKRDGWIE